METMKEIAVNVNGKGAMQLVTTLRAMKDGQVPAGRDVVFTSGEDGVLYVTDLAAEAPCTRPRCARASCRPSP